MHDEDAVTRTETVEVRTLVRLTYLQAVDALFVSVWGACTPVLGVELLRALSHEG